MPKAESQVVFKSKIGMELAIPTLLVLAAVFALMLWPTVLWFGAFTVVLTAIFAGYIFLSIRYAVRGNFLIVSCGFLYREEIPISGISEVRRSRDISSAPAASLRRLEIRYGKGKRVLVSPEREDFFISLLFRVNPDIVRKESIGR